MNMRESLELDIESGEEVISKRSPAETGALRAEEARGVAQLQAQYVERARARGAGAALTRISTGSSAGGAIWSQIRSHSFEEDRVDQPLDRRSCRGAESEPSGPKTAESESTASTSIYAAAPKLRDATQVFLKLFREV